MISTSSTKFVFFGPIRKTRWPPWPLIGWDLFRLLHWNRWTEFNETCQEARSQRPLPSLCFSGRSDKQDGRPWPLIGWDIFDFFSETAEWNSTKLDRKQDLNIPYQVCVFRADRKNKMAALASDWLRHFRLLLWNGWTEFNQSWQEARSQGPLPSLCFSGQLENQDGRPGLWLAETFDRKQDLKVLYQVCVFKADWKIKLAALASDWLRHFRLLLWNCWSEFNETWPKARSHRFLPSLCFLRPMSKQKFPAWLICQKSGTLHSGARYVAPWASCYHIWVGQRKWGSKTSRRSAFL